MSEPIFQGQFEAAECLSFSAGETVFLEGEPGDVLYIVLEGEVMISVGGKPIDTVKAGSVFGEMALVSGRPRVATAVAAAPTVLMPLERDTFLDKVQNDPEVALHTVQILIIRLRRSLQMLN